MSSSTTPARYGLTGLISSAGFASGDRLVVGHWTHGPLGPMDDVMWARPDGTRVLLAPTQPIADFISAVYRFDEVHLVPVTVAVNDKQSTLTLDAGSLHLELQSGRYLPLPPKQLRPAWFTRLVEGPIAKAIMGVSTFGTTPTGIHEWYRVDGLRYVQQGSATFDGRDFGALAPIDPPMAMGVSDPPKRPSMVRVRPLLHDPSGALDRVLGL